jgi:ParB family chromosome partitioning protein
VAKRRFAEGSKLRNIPLEALRVSEFNARQRERTTDLDELAESIAEIGILQPIVVQQKGKEFEVLVGQRRFLAATQLRLSTIPALVLPVQLNPLEARALSFTENVQRVDLSAKDKSETCKYLLDELGTVRAVSERLGISQKTVRKWLEYAAVPVEIRDLVATNQITRGVATRIAQSIDDESRAIDVARRLAEMRPPTAERDRILAAVEEFPDRPFQVVLRRAAEMQTITRVHFVLTESWAERLTRAAAKLEIDPNDIAREATIDWLKANRY